MRKNPSDSQKLARFDHCPIRQASQLRECRTSTRLARDKDAEFIAAPQNWPMSQRYFFGRKFKNWVLDCFSLRVAFFPWPVLVPVVAIVDPRPSCQHHLLNLWPLHPYLVLHFSDSTPGSLLLYEVHFYRHFNWRHCANFFVKNSKRFYRRCTNGGRRLGPG